MTFNIAELLRTKTFYAGLALIVTGIGLMMNDQFTEGIQTIGAGITTIFVREAISKAER